MVQPITMPKFGQTVTECKIVRWLKAVNDPIAKGDILFEIETDKATLEVESFQTGTLLKIIVADGESAPVQTVVAFVGDPGEPVPEVEKPKPSAAGTTKMDSRLRGNDGHQAEGKMVSRLHGNDNTRGNDGQSAPATSDPALPDILRISPRAAALANDCAISVSSITGAGPDGRITESDVRAYLAAKNYDALKITPAAKELARAERIDVLSVDIAGRDKITVADIQRAISEKPQPLSNLRRIIGDRMLASVQSAPHFFLTVSVDMTDIEAHRAALKRDGIKLSMTDFIISAVARTLVEYPSYNSWTDGKTVRRRLSVHIGLAVALEDGLVVPVIRNADARTLADIHDAARDLSNRARSNKLLPDEMSGSTFTISNMGMLDVENFTAIINPGETGILAVSSPSDQPVVRDGQIIIRKMMKITVSSDHRLIDGATAARFANSIKTKLETIETWNGMIS